MDRGGHNDDYNNGLEEGRIRTILHFANENERYLHWRTSLTSLTPARIRVHARAIMCMNYILYMTHTQVQNWAIITHFDSFLGCFPEQRTKNVTLEMKHSLHTGGKGHPSFRSHLLFILRDWERNAISTLHSGGGVAARRQLCHPCGVAQCTANGADHNRRSSEKGTMMPSCPLTHLYSLAPPFPEFVRFSFHSWCVSLGATF